MVFPLLAIKITISSQFLVIALSFVSLANTWHSSNISMSVNFFLNLRSILVNFENWWNYVIPYLQEIFMPNIQPNILNLIGCFTWDFVPRWWQRSRVMRRTSLVMTSLASWECSFSTAVFESLFVRQTLKLLKFKITGIRSRSIYTLATHTKSKVHAEHFGHRQGPKTSDKNFKDLWPFYSTFAWLCSHFQISRFSLHMFFKMVTEIAEMWLR